MKHLSMIASVAMIAAPFCFAEPKAYDLVNYTGKGTGMTVSFAFASGYPEASTLVVTSGGKTTKFRHEADVGNKMRFVATTVNAGKAEVTLKMAGYDDPPAKVEGTYTAGGKDIPITLTKAKK